MAENSNNSNDNGGADDEAMVQSNGKKILGGGHGGLPARTLSTLGSRAIITIYLRTQYNNYYLR